jgi:hypothetical protein
MLSLLSCLLCCLSVCLLGCLPDQLPASLQPHLPMYLLATTAAPSATACSPPPNTHNPKVTHTPMSAQRILRMLTCTTC